ncbi:TetR family transcriptional regulator C-terminal domain-containing protein [Arenibacter sp. M-2]|uniref:TetR family transcriptional regulator C-terminal domain-containing protein n=1 Tax=unclassified Arenibacter TaxID=2615047 RepID=UPI000D75765B|nr:MULTISPECIES: TetR family transcriptional regulator C-terminal domain-containing protein [unclassified Arenibacter]MDL5513063.1 TetR family transcriptional regulator C-terminal domain-containing protein [Arenibacter sp. M-2]
MAKKKTISENDIIASYMDFVLEHNENPKSVNAFAKANNFEESEFYKFFGSFEAVEKHVFKAIFNNTISVLLKSDDYKSFDARNKLLSFYFTFFENLTANRSYVVYALQQHKNSLKSLALLSELKKSFVSFVEGLNIETLDLKQEQIDKIQRRALQESAWLQLLLTLKFWMEDTSASFEKTDIFIEKSVNTSFDILNITPLKSVVDFGKFLFKERMHKN